MITNRSTVVLKQSNSLSLRFLSTTVAAKTRTHAEGAPASSDDRMQKSHFLIEGFQGSAKSVSLNRAKLLLSTALTHSQEGPGIQGIPGHGKDPRQALYRRFHTGEQRPLVQKTETGAVHVDNEASPQGVQGDDCVHFRLWRESCQRYGLDNCDQQLQGIQSGRKTLGQVLAEQDELIHSISQKYRQQAIARHQEEAAESCSVQGLQGDLSTFPTVDTPCPQGVQGEDCVRFKLWLENCHRFGFNECMDQLESLSKGRKSLGQVFAEQDQLIRSVVTQHQQRRGYSTSASDPKSDPQVGQTETPKLTQAERLKKTFKEYGATVIVFHTGLSLMSLGGFYLAVSSGIDMVAFMDKIGIGKTLVGSEAVVAGAGTFVVAYAVHKVFAPARIGITVSVTPFLVRYLRKIGILKPPKPKNIEHVEK
ncbi:uncharacterized protein LOC124135332 [Haliotis rufescens]|uniref:uncharacterized protein LOC124135332 n=1 Tax=Haliotis rufescens TaxID=6454 RepID=UPI00201F3BBB|nr:uncharacterized protein LOC124135332 [Haliotis rufescens]